MQTLSPSGASVTWAQPLTSFGGQYRLCWCPSGSAVPPCDRPEAFGEDVLRLDVAGPLEGQWTCVSGGRCEVRGVRGLYLDGGDRVAVLDTCGSARGAVSRRHRHTTF